MVPDDEMVSENVDEMIKDYSKFTRFSRVICLLSIRTSENKIYNSTWYKTKLI